MEAVLVVTEACRPVGGKQVGASPTVTLSKYIYASPVPQLLVPLNTMTTRLLSATLANRVSKVYSASAQLPTPVNPVAISAV